jgi:hypothetical protein
MRISLALFSIAVWLGNCDASASCLPFNGVKNLRGTLIEKSFPGPPNYESIKVGDKEERFWLLRTEEVICVDKDPEDENGANVGLRHITEIQLVLLADGYRRYRHLLGKPVQLSGSFFSAHTGHHKTPVLLDQPTIKALQ